VCVRSSRPRPFASVPSPISETRAPTWLADSAVAVPALAVYGPELFPTGQRGTANGGLQVVGVAGSSAGLLLVGWLSDRVGGLGQAMAIAAIAPAVLVLVVLFWFPETAQRELEDLNPFDRSLDPDPT